MKDLIVSSKGSSPVRERASLSLSAVKSLVLGEEKPTSEFDDSEKALSLIHLLLDGGKMHICWTDWGICP